MTINRNDKSTSISTQLDSLIPASKISSLIQRMFIGSVSDIPEILSFVDESGTDNMKRQI